MIIGAEDLAKRLDLTSRAVRKAAARGRFGGTAHRDLRMRWAFDWPAARDEYLRNTDLGRSTVAHLKRLDEIAPPRPAPPVDACKPDPEVVAFYDGLHARVIAAGEWSEEDLLAIDGVFDDGVFADMFDEPWRREAWSSQAQQLAAKRAAARRASP